MRRFALFIGHRSDLNELEKKTQLSFTSTNETKAERRIINLVYHKLIVQMYRSF